MRIINYSFYQAKTSKLEQLNALFKTVIEKGSVGGFPPGIFINEHHHHKFPKEFLMENFQYFKSIGIETLFFEFAIDNEQPLFDRLLESNGEVPIPVQIFGNEDTKAVAMAAIRSGIRVVALDCKAAREGSPEYFRHPTKKDWEEYYKRRNSIFDENARKIFHKEHKSKPYLFYSGLAHGNNHHGFPSFFPGEKRTLLLSDDGFNFQVDGIKQHFYIDEVIFHRDLGRNYSLISKKRDNPKIRSLKDIVDEGYLDEDRAAFLAN